MQPESCHVQHPSRIPARLQGARYGARPKGVPGGCSGYWPVVFLYLAFLPSVAFILDFPVQEYRALIGTRWWAN